MAVCHPIQIIKPPPKIREMENGCRVNSFHTLAVAIDAIAPPLNAFAVTEDGLAEGIFHSEAPIVAVQWHPERFSPFREQDQMLIRRVFGMEG